MEVFQVSENFIIRSSVHDYEVSFNDDFGVSLAEEINRGDIVLIDQNVYQLYNESLAPILDNFKYIPIEPSEDQKNFLNLAPLIENLIGSNFRKNNKLIAIGGGITQDIAAFISSNFYRGVGWKFYPTTLLSQCDSCIGGKSSINFGKYKNQLGNFYPPEKIIIDIHFLTTLNEIDIRSGMGEMIHFYLVSGEDDFDMINSNYDLALKDYSVLKKLISHSLQIKKKIIEIDEFDKKERLIFNYGHSFGHAIESLTGYRIPHGIAVSYGMDIANYISVKLGYISEKLQLKIQKLLKKNWGDTCLGEIDIQTFVTYLQKDKKNTGSKIRVILTKGAGKMFATELVLNEPLYGWLEDYFRTHV
jgi:3-dehydroquinate synthase